jgi:hypothetical protein
VLENNPSAKVVYCKAEFFGEKTGYWELPDFSLRKLATDNLIFCCALYRKTDWELAGGYDELMTWGWEDWEFWIAMLKSGGDVVRLPFVGFFYRTRKDSRRKSTNKLAKRKTIDLINNKHYDFVRRELGGPLRFNRSLSRVINKMDNFTRWRIFAFLVTRHSIIRMANPVAYKIRLFRLPRNDQTNYPKN